MNWVSQKPDLPGRYLWRAGPPDYEYGMCLIAWRDGIAHSTFLRQASLEVQTVIIFGTNRPPDDRGGIPRGETSDYPGWSMSGGSSLPEGCEFWSTPIGEDAGMPQLRAAGTNPSEKEVAKSKKARRETEKRVKAARKARAKELRTRATMALREKTSLYVCEDCDGVYDTDDLVTVQTRECPHCCSEFYVGPDDDRNCPECNRPFTRLVEKQTGSCPNCLGDAEPPVMVVALGVVTSSFGALVK